MAEAGVAPGAVINDAEGENLGADQEIPQQQAQGEGAVNIMNQVLIWIGFDVVANRQALRCAPYRTAGKRTAIKFLVV